MAKLLRPPADFLGILLVVLILGSFGLGAYRIDRQAGDIKDVVEAQRELTFEFRTSTDAIVTVECIRIQAKYACVTTRRSDQ